MDLSSKRSGLSKGTDDKRVFPFNQPTASIIWIGALNKTNLNGRDKSTNRHVYHPHTLRKFFRSRMSTMVQVDLVEEMMGHEGYLTNEYRRHTPEDLAKAYLQGESTLAIFGTTISLEQIEQQVDAKVDDKVEALQKVISNFAVENLELRKRVSTIEEGWKKQEFLYNKLEKIIGEKEAEMEVMKAFMEKDEKRRKQEEEQAAERQQIFDEARRE